MDEIMDLLETADTETIDEVFKYVLDMKRKAYPDWDIIYVSKKKGDAQQLKDTMAFLQKMFAAELAEIE